VPRLSQIRVVALPALCAALVAVSGCGGGDQSKDATTQDAEAKSDVRNLVSHVEACYAEEQTYDSCGTTSRLGGFRALPLRHGLQDRQGDRRRPLAPEV